MPAKRRNRILLSPSLIVSYLASASHAITNDFSAYPAAARSCLYEAADASACTGSTVYQMNLCLCSNTGNFVLATAACLSTNDQDDISSAYSMLVTSCSESNTPLAITRDQFQDAANHSGGDDDDKKSTTASSSMTQTQMTSATAPPSSTQTTLTTTTPTTTTTASQSMTTYKSVAGGVTVTVTREIESAPTETDSGNGDGDSDAEQNNNSNGGDSNHVAIIAGVGGGLAFLVAVLIYLFCHRRMLRRERIEQTGSSGKFAALSSATSLTTMTNTPQNDRPDTALTVPLTHGTAQWNQQQQYQSQQQQQQQQQQQGQVSPLHWQQQNLASPYGQPTATWPTPAASPNEPTGTFGVSPVSHYTAKSPPGVVVAHDAHDEDDWDTLPGLGLSPIPAPIPRPLTNSNSNHSYSSVFELPGDQTAPVEADSTPIGPLQHSNSSPSTHFQSTQPMQPAPAHHSMPRQVDDALQISQVELPPPRYTGPSSEWISDSKKLG